MTVLHETTSLCRVCKAAVPARVVARDDGAAWMEKECPAHGAQEVRLSDDAAWYAAARAEHPPRPNPPVRAPAPAEHGCPFDCGACAAHRQRVRLPVVTITSACNLDCPICYVHNKNDGAYHMGTDDFRATLKHLVDDHGGDLDLVNLTGGEPTLHPHILEFLEIARELGVHRVSLCTNGVRIARDEEFAAALARLGARVALSFDSFEPAADWALQGAHLVDLKLECLDVLERHDVDTTLIPVATKGVNDHELGRILDEGFRRKNVRHIEVHTITYTGQGGASYDRAGRISMREVLAKIAETTGGRLEPRDFVPSPCAHPLCYRIAYLLVDSDGGPPIPFTRFVDRETLHASLGEHLYLEPSPRLERALADAIDRAWSEGGPDAERTLRLLKRMLSDMFPVGRTVTREEALRAGERACKAVYVHSHMDEETFDVERIVDCCDSNCYADGTSIPVCTYNILYREKEAHFMLEPKRWGVRAGKRLPLVRGA